jgi:hypothetical protein
VDVRPSCARRNRYASLAAIGIAIGAFSIAELVIWGETWFPIVGVCVATFMGFYASFLTRQYLLVAPRRIYEYTLGRAPIVLGFGETGVTVESRHGRTAYAWSAFTGRIELPDLYGLLISDMSFVAVPRRDLAEADRQRFERTIARLPIARTISSR